MAANPAWRKVVDIDHSRLGTEAGSSMPPARVIIFSDPTLETAIIRQHPLAALELPLRALAFETAPGGDSKVIYNRFDYLRARYGLADDADLGQRYADSMALALQGIQADNVTDFPGNEMPEDGIITIDSPYDFAETLQRIEAAIESQDDTVVFGRVDFRAQAAALDVELLPSTMILFGAPGPGARAMSSAPTLGLDGFCQKFLVREDENGKVTLSFNDLLTLAERQGVKKSIPLRVVNFRLNQVFSEALEE